MEKPDQFIRRYEQAANSRNFDRVEPLIAEDAIFIFTDGIYEGREAIRIAFEATWSHILDERYTITQVRYLVVTNELAIYTYRFVSDGIVKGTRQVNEGLGTNVLIRVNNTWQILHEHLSKIS